MPPKGLILLLQLRRTVISTIPLFLNWTRLLGISKDCPISLKRKSLFTANEGIPLNIQVSERFGILPSLSMKKILQRVTRV